MPCKMCRARGKTWEGGDPKCAFALDAFHTDNWNCATMNALRTIAVGPMDGWEPEPGRLHRRIDDAAGSFGAIPFCDIECPDDEYHSGYVVMTWYKSRGQTGRALVMWDDNSPRNLTEATALAVIGQHLGDLDDEQRAAYDRATEVSA